MREIRTSGSEGGVAQPNAPSLPLFYRTHAVPKAPLFPGPEAVACFFRHGTPLEFFPSQRFRSPQSESTPFSKAKVGGTVPDCHAMKCIPRRAIAGVLFFGLLTSMQAGLPTSWQTANPLTPSRLLEGVTYGNGQFVAVGK